MSDDEKTTDEKASGGGVPNPVNDFITQLRGMADRLAGPAAFAALPTMPTLPTLPTMPSLPGLPGLPPMLPPPGALSAAQLSAMASAVAAQRGGIQALQAQLTAFDEQLAVLEQILGPLTAWSRSWADLERAVTPGGA